MSYAFAKREEENRSAEKCAFGSQTTESFCRGVLCRTSRDRPIEQCLVEIQPSLSCADTSHHAAGLAQQSDYAAFKSNQQACKADATWTEAENAGADEQSVVESTPQKSAEAVTAADSMPNEQLVSESQAKRSTEVVSLT